MAFKNPFFFRELSIHDPFCNRVKELKELEGYATGKANVVLYSPRRFGKTSLVRRVQHRLLLKDYTIIFVDFFGISSIEEVASRLAKAVFEFVKPKQSLFQFVTKIFKSFRPVLRPDEMGGLSLSVEYASSSKKGEEVLEEVFDSLEEFSQKVGQKLHIVFDEFQEITELKSSLAIEGVMRKRIQRHPFSYFFVGSRRHLLLAIFNEKTRPFFQSAINYELKGLPENELIPFLIEQFQKGGKHCPEETAQMVTKKTHCHPYYSQKLSFFIFEVCEATATTNDVETAYNHLLESEKQVFEAISQGLAPKQKVLLQAIALEPTTSLFVVDYMHRHRLGSSGGVQGGIKKLLSLDLIERNANQVWQMTDSLFKEWLARKI